MALKKSPPENRTASNDCLPYEKSYFLIVVSFLVVSVDIAEVSGAGAGAIAAESTGAVAAVSVAFSSPVPASLQAAKDAIANTNNSFFIVPFFVC
jgi:hypothetical protein